MMKRYEDMHKKLLAWYEEVGRHELPWRNTQDIYHVYLSEIMLQQTQVNRVRDEYYPRFLEKFPSLEALADAPLEDVLSLWSGLGYYRRAKNLHKTAQLARTGLPKSEQELKELPGIGAYTASAVCSFGYAQNVPVVDTNIARVLKRYFALVNPKERELWKFAEKFLNSSDPRHHNLALMDLGSMVCTPKNPECQVCPLALECQGKGEPELYTQVKKKESVAMELFFGVMIQDGKIALKYSDENMYKDMLVLPNVEPLEERLIGSYKHAYTKYRLSVYLYEVEELSEEVVWVDLERFDTLPISSLTKKAQRYFRV